MERDCASDDGLVREFYDVGIGYEINDTFTDGHDNGFVGTYFFGLSTDSTRDTVVWPDLVDALMLRFHDVDDRQV